MVNEAAPAPPVDPEPVAPRRERGRPSTGSGRPELVEGRKRRLAGRLVRWALALVVAIVAAVFVTVFSVDLGNVVINGKSLRSLAESRGSEFLGRKVTIGRIGALVSPGDFALDDVVIAGATEGATPFFTAKRIRLHVPWWTILLRREAVVEVRMTGWRMVTELFADRRPIMPNFRRKSSGPRQPSKWLDRTTVNFVYATDGEFVYIDHVTPWNVVCRNLTFNLVRAPSLNAYVGTAHFENGTVQIQQFLPMRTDFDTRFVLDAGKVRVDHIDLLTDGAKTHVTGLVDFENWPDQTYNVDSVVDFPRMREIFFANEKWDLTGEGRFKGIFRLWKNGDRDLSGTFVSRDMTVNSLRLTDLDGSLTWLKDRFAVTHADADFYGGRVRMAYALEPLGSPGGSTAKFHADVENGDLAAFRRDFSFHGLQPVGRFDGEMTLEWPNGQFARGKRGAGNIVVSPPAGVRLAGPALPPAEPLPPRPPPATPGAPKPKKPEFDKFPPLGPFPMGAHVDFTLDTDGFRFDRSWAANPTTYVSFDGRTTFDGSARVPFHVTSLDWQASDYLLAAILTAVTGERTGAIPVAGRGTFDGEMTGPFNRPRIEGEFAADHMKAWDVLWGRARGHLVIENRYLDITDGMIGEGPEASIRTKGRYSLGYPRADAGEEINAHIELTNWPLGDIRHAFEQDDWPIDGRIAAATLDLRGAYEHVKGTGTLRLEQGVAWNERFERAGGNLEFDGRGVNVTDITMNKGDGVVTGAANLRWDDATYSFTATGTRVPVQLLDNFQFPKAPLTGLLNFEASGSSSFDNPAYDFSGRIADLFIGDEGIGQVDGTLHVKNKLLVIERLNIASSRLQVFGSGSMALNDASDARLDLTFTNSSIDPYLKFFAPEMSPYTRAIVSGRLTADGPIAAEHIDDLRVEVTIDSASLTLFDYELKNEGPITLRFDDHAFKIPAGQLTLAGQDTRLAMSGIVDSRAQRVDLSATGQASLAVLQLFFPTLGASGGAKLNATYRGPFGAATLSGRAEIENGRLRIAGLTQTLNEIHGPITFDTTGINVSGMRARFGESDVVFGGNITLDGMKLREYNLTARGQQMAVRYPPGLRSIVDANLYFRGPVDAPTLGGDVVVTQAEYRPVLPSNTGLIGLAAGGLGGGGGADTGAPGGESTVPVRLAIDIRAPRTRFINNESATVNGRANLQVVGTLDRPQLTGRVDIESGEVRLGATRLLVQPGTIDFVNNTPVFDVEAITRPRVAGQTYDIDVRLRGTLDKLTPTFSSDPYLPNMQIVAMVLGSVPSDEALRSAQLQASTSQQDLQRSALTQAGVLVLTSPISATIGTAVKKTLPGLVDWVGVTPLLTNVTDQRQLNPGVRITLGKRISDKMFITYSRALNSQYEIILVEFEQSDRLSWVLSRNEDRSFALDFRVRHVF